MKRKRLVLLLVCSMVGVYVLSYLVDSICGGYRLVFVSSINQPINYARGIDAKTNGGAIAWQPRYGRYTRLSSDGVGKFFYPLIWMDQTFWHRDVPSSEIKSRESFEKRVPLREIHPDDRRLYGARRLD